MPCMREEQENLSAWDAWAAPRIKSTRQVLEEMSRPCSRFSFDPRHVKSDIRSAHLAARIDPFSNQTLLYANGTPANWQLFARYLFEKGITGGPTISFYKVRNDVPKMYHAIFRSHDMKEGMDGREANRYGYGCSLDQEEAVSKAVGELLERHFLAGYRNSDLVRASYDELNARRFGPRPIDISELNGFLPHQMERFPILKRTPGAPLRWVVGTNAADGSPAYIPAQFIYWNYFDPEEMFLGESNSNGAAGGFTRDEAILSGLLEYIQRDGFVIHWLKVESPRRIDPETIADPQAKELLYQLRKRGFETHLVDVTTDVGVPTCVCVILDRRRKRHELHMGAGVGFDEKEVFVSAIKEAIAGLNRPFDEYLKLPEAYVPFYEKFIGLEQRLRLWWGETMLERFAPFIKGTFVTSTQFMRGMDSYRTSEEQLALVKDRLKSLGKGYEIYWYEAQDRTLSEVGYHAVKVFVPKLISLYLWDTNAQLASERLSTIPSKLGYSPRSGVNPWPHPFP